MRTRRQKAFGLAFRLTVTALSTVCLVNAFAPEFGALRAFGQTPPSDVQNSSSTKKPSAETRLPVYDLVTIRPSKPEAEGVDIDRDTNTYAATNVSLLNLIHDAYDILPSLVSGTSKWVSSAHFDVRAKVVDADPAQLKGMSRKDRKGMLQVLLADRFHLQVHTEVKTLPVLELVQARSGAKLTEIAPEHKEDRFKGMQPGSTEVHSGSLAASYRTMADLADTLSGQVHRPVVDKTGLTGHYNFQLNWARDDAPVGDAAAAPPLLTALEEQLGLRLAPGRGEVKTLVIDRADMPVEDEN